VGIYIIDKKEGGNNMNTNLIDFLRREDCSNSAIIDALCDGEICGLLISEHGYTQEDIEDAYNELTR
jgi:hypothetical protein